MVFFYKVYVSEIQNTQFENVFHGENDFFRGLEY